MSNEVNKPDVSTAKGAVKGIRTVANLCGICPRHREIGLAKTRVASGQRGPRYT